jgi:hypothetical protein
MQPRKEDLDSSCYHHPQKGCELVWFGYYGKNKKYIRPKSGIDEVLEIEQRAYLSRGKCRTHKVIVCHCGYEVGTHAGRIDKGYKASLI